MINDIVSSFMSPFPLQFYKEIIFSIFYYVISEPNLLLGAKGDCTEVPDYIKQNISIDEKVLATRKDYHIQSVTNFLLKIS